MTTLMMVTRCRLLCHGAGYDYIITFITLLRHDEPNTSTLICYSSNDEEGARASCSSVRAYAQRWRGGARGSGGSAPSDTRGGSNCQHAYAAATQRARFTRGKDSEE